MTGGTGTELSADIILEDGTACTMTPGLPSPGRRAHSASGLTLCGGQDAETTYTCSTFTGQWETSHSLSFGRYDHVSWLSPDGIILIGGGDPWGWQTSELLSNISNTTTIAFHAPSYYSTFACGIPLENTIVVTGGLQLNAVPGSRVQVYNTSGEVEQLPDINTPRHSHACGHYIKDGKMVSIYLEKSKIRNQFQNVLTE